ncbi:hypothetical protein EZV62_000452 [Acer yangbiense]|uniref:J domain-containing protein n=1 Tax=Acer yangbiense TaxID=1000413 RepID=A0A5C7IR61_9ROSI|nr:hypothetical protein EZV62_000452 [Acer yangbiense]
MFSKSEFEKVHRNHYSFFEDLNEKDAEFCRDKAEELFKKEQFILAVSTIAVAFLKNPDPGLISYPHAYEVHMAVKQTNKNYYAILGIQDHRAPIDTIKKNYKEKALMFHPDQCSSVAAEGATKFINEAWGIISDPEKRKTYDLAKGYRSVVQPATAELQPCNPLEVDLIETNEDGLESLISGWTGVGLKKRVTRILKVDIQIEDQLNEEFSNQEPSGRHLDLSLQIPLKPLGFGSSRNEKVLQSQGSYKGSSPSLGGFFSGVSFKKKNVVSTGERSSLSTDSQPAPESPNIANVSSAFSWQRCSVVGAVPTAEEEDQIPPAAEPSVLEGSAGEEGSEAAGSCSEDSAGEEETSSESAGSGCKEVTLTEFGLGENLDDFKKMTIELANAGVDEKLSDDNEAIILLNSLLDSFKDVKAAIKYGRTSLSLDECISAFKSKDLELKMEKNDSGENLF